MLCISLPFLSAVSLFKCFLNSPKSGYYKTYYVMHLKNLIKGVFLIYTSKATHMLETQVIGYEHSLAAFLASHNFLWVLKPY